MTPPVNTPRLPLVDENKTFIDKYVKAANEDANRFRDDHPYMFDMTGKEIDFDGCINKAVFFAELAKMNMGEMAQAINEMYKMKELSSNWDKPYLQAICDEAHEAFMNKYFNRVQSWKD